MYRTVTDQDGARIPRAEVKAIQSATGLQRKTYTSSEGSYVLDGLPLGQYSVVFSKQGFKDFRDEQVEQLVGQTHTLNATLTVGNAAERGNTLVKRRSAWSLV